MISLLMTFGVEEKDMSPLFAGHYHGNITEDLKKSFLDYMPSKTSPTTFKDKEKEEEDEQAEFADDANNDSVVSNEILHKRLIDEFLATLSERLIDKDDIESHRIIS